MSVKTRFASLIRKQTLVKDAISMMGSLAENKHIAGFAVVVDEQDKVIGALTDGDIRRGLAKGFDINSQIEKVANFKPITINKNLAPALMRRKLMDEARKRGTHFMKYDKLILIEDDGRFYDVILLTDILEPSIDDKTIAIYGLGFVGLTLACTFANSGLSVVGIDTNTQRLEMLAKNIAPFYEKGLDSMLYSLAATNPIRYTDDAKKYSANIHIISVGSPIKSDGKPDLSAIEAVSETVSGILKNGDLVIFRSTVPVGTMRHIVLPILEKNNMSCGTDFYLAFAPERTVEGNALEELRILPQIIGGFNQESSNLASRLFRKITNVIVDVQSLEEAEIVKLMNNTYRDLIFSFANEIAYMCDDYNINAFRIIRAANEGYPRDRIPMPSPGVGGICLSKDPLLYSQPIAENGYSPVLGRTSRSINKRGSEYVLAKIEKFSQAVKIPVEKLRILVVGLAFKGMPETSDIRDSIATNIVNSLPNKANISVKDFVVSSADIESLGCTANTGELQEILTEYDVVLFMNNHYRNNKFNVIQALQGCEHSILFFDGWSMFDWREIERLPNVCYATMGYSTAGFLS
ncbi:MAG: nucleotide sugar dehydrogenase [Rickettsiales bacterium]